jgi:hypothetical protein
VDAKVVRRVTKGYSHSEYNISASSPLAVWASFCKPVLPRAKILAFRAAARRVASDCGADSTMLNGCV